MEIKQPPSVLHALFQTAEVNHQLGGVLWPGAVFGAVEGELVYTSLIYLIIYTGDMDVGTVGLGGPTGELGQPNQIKFLIYVYAL